LAGSGSLWTKALRRRAEADAMLGSKRLKKAIKESPTAVRNALVSRLRIEVSDLSKGGISAAVKFPSHSITGWEKDKSAFVF